MWAIFFMTLLITGARAEVWEKPDYVPDENHLPQEEEIQEQEEHKDKKEKKERNKEKELYKKLPDHTTPKDP